jgi:hypothetical protein
MKTSISPERTPPGTTNAGLTPQNGLDAGGIRPCSFYL